MISPYFADIEVNNKQNILKRHIKSDDSTSISNNLILKYNDPIHTYIVIESSGPSNGILTLVDETGNPLYSSYDPDGYARERICQITIGQREVIVLPKNMQEGSKNWKLHYHDPEGIYNDQTITLPSIKIEDFSTWAVTSPIYPNEELKVTTRTYVNTIDQDLSYTYNNKEFTVDSNGVITFTGLPQQFELGDHSYILNKKGTSETKVLDYYIKFLPYYLATMSLDDNKDIQYTKIALNNIDGDELITDITLSNGDLIITTSNIQDMSDNNVNNGIQSIELDINGDLIITR